MELTNQILIFSITILTGILLGMLFDCYRVLRNNCKPREIWTWFTDLLYWLLATVVVFTALIASNWGELRFYVFMGILSGLGMYYSWLSLYAIRLFTSGIRLLIRSVGLLKKVFDILFLRPGIYGVKIVSWPFIIMYRKFISWYSMRWRKPPADEKK